MVSQQLLKELQEIIEQEYSRNDLSMEEISEIGNGLVNYYDLLNKMYYENNQNYENLQPKSSNRKS